MTENLTRLEKSLIANRSRFQDIAQKDAFSVFCLQRDVQLGGLFPVKEPDKNRLILQEKIEFFKSLGLCSKAYVDNLVFYFFLMSHPSPLLERNYLLSILDAYIKPEGRSRKSGVFNRILAGYFVYSVTRESLEKKSGASIGAAIRALRKTFPLDGRAIKRTYLQIKKGFSRSKEKPEETQETFLVFDMILISMLCRQGLDLEKIKETIGKHHHTQAEHERLIRAYQKICNDVAYALLDEQVKSGFEQRLPYFVETFTPELFSKVRAFDKNKNKIDFSPLEAAGLLVAKVVLSNLPNIAANLSLAEEATLLPPKK